MTKHYDVMTLDEVKTALAGLPAGARIQGVDGEWFSDRGSYRNLALLASDTKLLPAADLFRILEDATGQTMTGWKGGEFEVQGGNVVAITDEEGRSGEHICGLDILDPATNTWEFVTVANAYII